MQDKISKLCKRLNRFTLEDISLIAECEEKETEKILQELIKKNKIEKRHELYIYTQNQARPRVQKRLPLFFQCHSKEVIDIIVKGFCSEVDEYKVMFLTNKLFAIVYKFNKYFRQTIFEKQKQELLKYHNKEPKQPWEREFFDQKFFFYSYKNKVFISEKKLKAPLEKPHSKDELTEFKRVYSYIKRHLTHNTRKYYPFYYLAEAIWRRNKNFKVLEKELNKFLGRV